MRLYPAPIEIAGECGGPGPALALTPIMYSRIGLVYRVMLSTNSEARESYENGRVIHYRKISDFGDSDFHREWNRPTPVNTSSISKGSRSFRATRPSSSWAVGSIRCQ